MSTADITKTVFGVVVIVALAAAALLVHFNTPALIPHETTIIVEQSAFNSPAPAPSTLCAVIDVLAYVRTDARLVAGDVQWLFSVNRDDSASDYECYFEPCSTVDNLAMSNQDGSEYFVGMMKGRIFLRKRASFRSVSYELPQRCYLPSGFDTPREPTIILEGSLSATGFNIEWTTANLPTDSCKILFKYLDQQDDSHLPLICMSDGYCI